LQTLRAHPIEIDEIRSQNKAFSNRQKTFSTALFLEDSKKSSADFFQLFAHLMLNDLTPKIILLHKNLLRALGLDANLTPLKHPMKRMWKVCS